VSGNQVLGRNGNGIFIKAHAEPCGNNNSIIGNTVAGALYNSIELSFCTGNKINGNTFRDGLDGVWLGFAHDNEINDNTIVNMKNHGIISSNSHHNTISGNHISNANVGLLFYSESYDQNFFYFLAKDGDYTSHDNCLCNNVFQSNTISIHLKDSTFNRVNNNDLRGNGRGILLQGNTKGNNTDGNQS
jgi:parallel beta-helix repeat protein